MIFDGGRNLDDPGLPPTHDLRWPLRVGRISSLIAGLVAAGTVAALFAINPLAAPGDDICRPGYAREHRLPPAQYYPIAEAAFARAGIPWAERRGYRLDHILPLELGGGWEPGNLQIQTIADAAAKDQLENRAHRMVCAGAVS